MKASLLLSAMGATGLALALAACSESIPDYGVGPFRGALLDPTPPELRTLPAVEEPQEVEVAVAPPKSEPEPAPMEPVEPAETVNDEANPVGETPLSEEPSGAASELSESATEEPVNSEDEEVELLNFDDLADFDYTPPTLDEIDNGTERPEQVPEEVLAYHNKVVEIEGYMIPIEVEQGKVKSFILSRTLSGCCFGDMPNIQEWVDVHMEDDKEADYVPYAPILVIGRISIGELVDEYGITSLYRMTAESVEDPW